MESRHREVGSKTDDEYYFEDRTPFEIFVDENTVGGAMYGKIAEIKKEHSNLSFELSGVLRQIARAIKAIKEKGPSFFNEGGVGPDAFNEFIDNLTINGPVFEHLYRRKKEKIDQEKRIDPNTPTSEPYFDEVSRAIAKGFQKIKAQAPEFFKGKE